MGGRATDDEARRGALTLRAPRFKLKFSTDKVDTMVIQAIALLDDLDKEINIYSMRVKVGDAGGRGSVCACARMLTGGYRNGTVGISQRWERLSRIIWRTRRW